jgi:hypothetical protein
VWIWDIVDFPDVVALFEEEMSVVEYICHEPMTFDIYLQYALHIHEFDIIDEEETRMDKYHCMIRDEHNTSEIVYAVQYELDKKVIHCHEEDREEYIVTKIRRKNSSVCEKYPHEENRRNKEKEKLRRHEKQEDTMPTNSGVLGFHIFCEVRKVSLIRLQKQDNHQE